MLSQAVNTVVSPDPDPLIVKSNVMILSHPVALTNVSLYIPLNVYFVPLQSALSHATNIVVSPIFSGLTVKAVTTILSQVFAAPPTIVSLYVPLNV